MVHRITNLPKNVPASKRCQYIEAKAGLTLQKVREKKTPAGERFTNYVLIKDIMFYNMANIMSTSRDKQIWNALLNTEHCRWVGGHLRLAEREKRKNVNLNAPRATAWHMNGVGHLARCDKR